jgi:hypothetical protein
MEATKNAKKKRHSEKTKKVSSRRKPKRETNENLYFANSTDYERIRPGKPSTYGTTWEQYHMEEKVYQDQVEKPLEEAKQISAKALKKAEQTKVGAQTFSDAAGSEDSEDEHYYNSEEHEKNFKDPEHIKTEFRRKITGQTPRKDKGKKPRRRQKIKEVVKEMKDLRYAKNTRCQICERATSKKLGAMLITNCECSPQGGNAPPAKRFHEACLKEGRTTLLRCKKCRTVVMVSELVESEENEEFKEACEREVPLNLAELKNSLNPDPEEPRITKKRKNSEEI